ncbi:hypothetical protein GQ43DRAFT_481198 [Delitschia confertaspora ATCC 74209]|uniref:Uncharacterized protein n=1 Tax=Delitschia confertaspora ATCC 74209 TaxID=1513339 RepID=A0A9P4MPM5_9PLEO|nr:hypothetical protein GQ43DRAFT_481198 [Delitschia confertaspora ATCC 74209]
MAPITAKSITGKRKRVSREELLRDQSSPERSSSEEQSDTEDIQAIFRRAFEAKFKPIDVEPVKKAPKIVPQEEEEEEESAWSGISDEEEDKVEVVEYVDTRRSEADRASKTEMKAFMSSKPPTAPKPAPPPSKSKPKSGDDDDDITETANLKNDMALQQLLRDSHLLSSNPSASSGTTLTGALRHKSTDLTLLSLGAKKSIHTQAKMPRSHRIGITEKARQREQKRRTEARENGIILERASGGDSGGKGRVMKKREKGVGGPGVGRMRGGTLNLSRRDLADINGPPDRKGKKKGKGRR